MKSAHEIKDCVFSFHAFLLFIHAILRVCCFYVCMNENPMHAMCMRLRKKEKERTIQGEKANEKEDILRIIFVRLFRKIYSLMKINCIHLVFQD